MLVTNVSPRGDLDVPALHRVVTRGETVNVPDAVGAALIEQTENWQPVQPEKEKS